MATKKTKKTAPTQPELSPAATKAFHTCRVCGDTTVTANALTCNHPECLQVGEIIDQVNNHGINDAAIMSDFRKIKDWYTIRLCAFAYERFPNAVQSNEDRLFNIGLQVVNGMTEFPRSFEKITNYEPSEVMERRKTPALDSLPVPPAKDLKCVVCGDLLPVENQGSRVCPHTHCAQCEKLVAIALSGDAERLKIRLKEAGPVVQMMVYFAVERFFPAHKFAAASKEREACDRIDDTLREIRGPGWVVKDPLTLSSEEDIQEYRNEKALGVVDQLVAKPSKAAVPERLNHECWIGHFGEKKKHYARNLAKLFAAGYREAWIVNADQKQAEMYYLCGHMESDTKTYATKAEAQREIERLTIGNIPRLETLHRLRPSLHIVRCRKYSTPMEIWHEGNGINLSRLCKLDKSIDENIKTVRDLMADPNVFEDSISSLDDILCKLESAKKKEAAPAAPAKNNMAIVIKPPSKKTKAKILESLDNAGKPIPSGLTCPVCGREDCQHRFCKMVQTALDVADPAAAEMIIPTIGSVEALDVAYWMEEAAVKGESRPWLITLLDTAAGVLASELNVRRLRDEECTEDAIAELLEKNGPDWPAIPGTVAASGDPDASYAEDLQAGEETGVLVLPKAPVERLDAEYVDENEEAEKNQPELPGMPPPDKKRFLYILHDPRQDGHGSVREIMASSMGSAAKEIMLRLLIDLKEIDVYQEQRAIAAMEIEGMLQDMPPWSTFIVHLNKRGIAVSFSEVDGFASRIYKKALVHGSFRMLKASALPVQGA
jgi:hypothetical protein